MNHEHYGIVLVMQSRANIMLNRFCHIFRGFFKVVFLPWAILINGIKKGVFVCCLVSAKILE